ncbi:phosphate ABC transporter ATP-binding protein PstB [Labilibaculum sp. DW002]|uniref:Phosphate ABC transporter ATP-binding protein PstB n=1 Tax=Paralabilibaculum antarcticum TaxID=2912572 RepID=A0ABT5VLW7_9BACT|nr:phosphate ABC transporter ATP-binding protein PstB [Labilibaculum sp. DW002]MDE5416419.1 phosphate ABC transporter ATP-binding protein PstB [Labilibaculum sp. DW002]
MESTILEKEVVATKEKEVTANTDLTDNTTKTRSVIQNPIENITSPILNIDKLSVSYGGDKYSINDVTAGIAKNKITAIMGPSGCGKSTLLRAINRMHELYPNTHNKGAVYLGDENIYDMNPILLRRKIGMVFQRPNPFPTMSIYDNVIAGYKLNGIKLKRAEKDAIVEKSLREVGLWSEVKDSLHNKGTFLSGGQQQRLCIARALAYTPEIILLDEPTSALDPIATAKIEDLLVKLKKDFTIVLVTHNMSQAARISDYSMFMYLGELVEYGKTKQMFTTPKDKRTEEYLTGKFG